MRRAAAGAITVVLAGVLTGCSHEAADWKAASTANTPEAYQQFLQQHPSGADADEARARVKQLADDHDWQVAAAADTREAYEQFLAQHADSKWAQEARIRIENFAQAAAGAAPAAAPGSASAAVEGATPAGAGGAPAASATTHPANVAAHVKPAAHAKPVARAGAKAARHGAGHSTASASRTLVQLGAFRSRSAAETEWKKLAARYPAQLKKLKPIYMATKSKSGVVYRLRLRLSSPSGARELCTALKHHAQPCVPVAVAARQPGVTA